MVLVLVLVLVLGLMMVLMLGLMLVQRRRGKWCRLRLLRRKRRGTSM